MSGRDLTLEDDSRAGIERAFERDPGSANLPTPSFGQQIEQVPLGAQRVAVMRDESKILQRIKAFAAAAGDDFYYQWETKNRDGTKGLVEGASIQCALYVLRTYGNCDVDMRVQDTGTHWVFYARFTDFETGFRLTRAFQQRKDQSTGMKDKDRQADIVFQIGQSKAIRNVVCNAIRPFTDYAFDEAKHSLIEKVSKNIAHYRAKIAQVLSELHVNVDRVERIVGRPLSEWLARDAARVIAEIQSVKDKMMDADDMWPPITIAVGTDKPKPEDFKETVQTEDSGEPEEKKAETKEEKKAEPAKQETVDPKAAEQASGDAKPAEEKKAEPDKVPEKPKFPPAPQGVNADWWADNMKAIEACGGIHGPKGLDALQEEMENAVQNDDVALKVIQDVCNARAREIMGKQKAAKKK